MTTLTVRKVLEDVSLVRPLGLPPSFPVSSTIMMRWMRDQDTVHVTSEGIALFAYCYHRGAGVSDPEMRAVASATMAVKISGNYHIIDILDREEKERPGFKRRLRNAELEILQSI